MEAPVAAEGMAGRILMHGGGYGYAWHGRPHPNYNSRILLLTSDLMQLV